jgi:hypothetical protein
MEMVRRCTAGTTEFYDRRTQTGRLLLGVGITALIITFAVAYSWRNPDPFFRLFTCLLVPGILLSLPGFAQGTFLAYRGAPTLRMNNEGLWARDWSSLGWIRWRDVALTEITITYGKAGEFYELAIHLTDEAFARLSGRNQVSIMLGRLFGFLFFYDAGRNRLGLTTSSELKTSWDDFMSTLDPILQANGVRKLEKAGR